MNAKRRTLADVVGPVALEHPKLPERPARPGASQETPAEPPAGPDPGPDPAEAPRPPARSLITPRRQVSREALKADVPAELALLQRLRRYRLDTGTDIRDQVAIAVDEWLTGQGY